MDIFVYSDESGVFDNVHNDIFVYGGLIFFNKNDKDVYCRKYIHAEKKRLYYCSVNDKNMSEIKNLIVTYLP